MRFWLLRAEPNGNTNPEGRTRNPERQDTERHHARKILRPSEEPDRNRPPSPAAVAVEARAAGSGERAGGGSPADACRGVRTGVGPLQRRVHRGRADPDCARDRGVDWLLPRASADAAGYRRSGGVVSRGARACTPGRAHERRRGESHLSLDRVHRARAASGRACDRQMCVNGCRASGRARPSQAVCGDARWRRARRDGNLPAGSRISPPRALGDAAGVSQYRGRHSVPDRREPGQRDGPEGCRSDDHCASARL